MVVMNPLVSPNNWNLSTHHKEGKSGRRTLRSRPGLGTCGRRSRDQERRVGTGETNDEKDKSHLGRYRKQPCAKSDHWSNPVLRIN